MLLFSVRNYIYLWAWSLLLLSILFLSLFFYLLITNTSLNIFLDIFSFSESTLTLSLLLDFYSSLFSFSVSFISCVVFFFISHYFHTYTKITYFLWLTFLFVLSILILINFSDLFFIILGWDGLGIVSFFLILYYQSPVSTYSSLFTLLINRIGDCLFVVVILLFSYTSPFLGFYISSYPSYFLLFLLLLTLSTKSALFPFSPWLPAAIAAPTPISSLVHSSTLVTAGLYIILRNFSLLSSSSNILLLLSTIGLFTSFYAGLSSLVEPDLKKVVALSTLSHLGFISFALGLGWCLLAFFHLLSHAFFKSSLFISLGSFISSHYHYQESRVFSSLSQLSPSISSIISLSEFSLIGFPFVSGFYSKDFILESFSYSSLSYFLVLVVYLNLLLTYTYVFRILSSIITYTSIPSYLLVPSYPSSFLFILSLLSLTSLSFGVIFYSSVTFQLTLIPSFLKYLPFILLSSFFFLWTLSFMGSNSLYSSSYPVWFTHIIGYIIYLTLTWTNLLSKKYLSLSSSLYRFELGIFTSLSHSFLVECYFYLSSFIHYFYIVSFKYSSLSTIIGVSLLLLLLSF